MKRIKRYLTMLFVFFMFLGCYTIVKAEEVDFNSIPNTLDRHAYLHENDSPKDYMNYFYSIGKAGWQPRIKYVGADEYHIQYYLFCLSFERKAPIPSINYTLNTMTSLSDITDAQYAYAYIIQNGFYSRSHANDYQDLLWDYYITSMAIYQYQFEKGLLLPSSGFQSIRTFNTADTIAKGAILKLVDQALSVDSSYKKFVAIYNPSDSEYQIVSPALIYTVMDETEDEVIITNPQIQIIYNSNCLASSNYNLQLKDTSGNVLYSWFSNNTPFLINNIQAGTYTLYDVTNNKQQTIVVKDQDTIQTYSLYVPDEVCEVEKQNEKPKLSIVKKKTVEEVKTENPKTNVAINSILLSILLISSITIYKITRKKNKFKI